MKKLLTVALILAMCFALSACGSASKDSAQENTEVKKDFEGNYDDMGSGQIVVSTPAGDSKDGNIPVLFVEDEDMMIQIGLDTYEIDGSKLSYIYIDGVKNSSGQYGETQTTLSLEGDALAAGKHKVELVQYEGDDDSGNVVTYKFAEYEVKKAK